MITTIFEIIENTRFTPHLSLLKLRAPQSLPTVAGGQFVNVMPPAEAHVMLRRPISVCNVVPEANELWLLVKDLGRASHELCKSDAGGTLDILLPLGHGFSFPASKEKKILLAGGGVGIAPLLYWGKMLHERGYHPTFLLAGRTSTDVPMTEEYRKYGELYLSTEDGSMGEKGLITSHPLFSDDWDMVYCCGPMPMMKAVGASCIERNIECEVSLENKMACGLGACLCCVEDTHHGHKCTCTDGPVFNIRDLKW